MSILLLILENIPESLYAVIHTPISPNLFLFDVFRRDKTIYHDLKSFFEKHDVK